ncbi:hypothetical protein D3C75_207120 [compost metagenome]
MLRHVVGRGGLTGKDVHARYPISRWVFLDAVVADDDVKHVHQLTFVLVDSFDLHVEQCFRIGDHV